MKQEELNRLRNVFLYLADGENAHAIYDMINMLSECMFQIITIHGKEESKSQEELEAKLVMQMMFSKLQNLKMMLSGFNYQSRNGLTLSDFIDPTVIVIIVRTIYETIAMFNLIYLIPQSDEEKKILYNLWAIAGLKYRQRFKHNATTTENQKKQTDEADKVKQMISEIEQTSVYRNLTEAGKNVIQQQIKKKDYKIQIVKNGAISLSWDGIMPIMGMDTNKMGVMYTYFSLYAHPSNVAVFQYKELFEPKKNDHIQMANFNLSACIKMVCFFIGNYIAIFPETIKIFESLPLIEQVMINYNSKFIRTDGDVINNALVSLGRVKSQD
jgi:hypothetical protein